MKKKIFLFVFISLLFVSSVYAKEYNNKRLILDDKVVVDSDLDNSSLIMGNNVELSSKVDGLGIILGNEVMFNAVSDYFITFGNNITFDGKVRDGLIFGNKVIFNESSTIGRDVIIFASSVNISGSINRNIEIYANDVTIKDVQISGNLKIRASTIDIERNADIIGELSYNDNAKVNISDVASIGSKKTYVVEKEKKNELVEKIKTKLVSFVNILVIFAILLYLFPNLFSKLDKSRNNIVKNIGVGLVTLIIIPIIILIFIFTLFGISLAILLACLYAILIYLSTIVTGYILGCFIWDKLIKIDKRLYLVGVIGIFILYILKLIPYISNLVTVISVVIGVGSIISLYHRKK